MGLSRELKVSPVRTELSLVTRPNIARREFGNAVLLLAPYLEHLRHALLFASAGVVHLRVARERPAVNPEVRQLAHERVRRRLEHQRSHVPVAVAGQFVFVLRPLARAMKPPASPPETAGIPPRSP